MKNLLIVMALFAAICYFGKAQADVEAWKRCAYEAVQPELELAKKDELKSLEKVCAFYQKPMEECKNLIEKASQDEVGQILEGYLFHAVIVPKCGTPNAAQ
jgi:hypothetical protein